MRRALPLFALLAAPALAAEPPDADALLTRIDQNLTFDTRSSTATMTVVKPRRTKVYELRSYARGGDEGATEFLSPARDAGTKMLKKGDELWMYLPSIEKVQKLSGHMLRQGVMGSDMSYEDLLEASAWRAHYTATVTGEAPWEGRPAWVVELTATAPDVAYARRVVHVDQEWGLPVHQELYAVSGTLLKTWTMSEPKAFGERWYPTKMVVTDALNPANYTELVFTEVSFSVPLEEEVFSQRWLER
ncbi:MAG: outer membrane lipoprotein-sorting protein [Alphaproteobacteria bacterium]|nr:outer membrane lipoprotein-sorting protein [Alphaproteobacteria bacterium]